MGDRVDIQFSSMVNSGERVDLVFIRQNSSITSAVVDWPAEITTHLFDSKQWWEIGL